MIIPMSPVVHAHYIRYTPGFKENGGTATAWTEVAALGLNNPV